MSDQQPPTIPAKVPVAEDQYFPPPPPGPPPGYAHQTPAQHTTVPQINTISPTTIASSSYPADEKTHVPPTNTVPPTTSYPADQKTHIPPAASHVPPAQVPGATSTVPPTAHQYDPLKHTNDTPLPDFDVPHYAPQRTDSDLYNATPPRSPPLPPRPGSSDKHDGQKHKRDWSQKLSEWGTKAAVPFNALANKMGSEGFLPQTLDKECEKAARILRSFAKDGIYSETTPPTAPPVPGVPAATDAPAPQQQQQQQPTVDPKTKKPKVLLTIPSKVIARAQGLAIFTTARAGFQVSGATGSGILIGRLPDGTWSPPSGIQVHSVGAGLVMGVDIYDCVVVINTREALEAFTRTRLSLGSDLAVTAGPYGAGGALDFGAGVQPSTPKGKEKAPAAEPHLAPPPSSDPSQPPAQPSTDPGAPPALPPRKPSPFGTAMKNPVYSYVKSRGFYAGVQVDGTVITERKDANAAFYGVPVSVQKVLRGEVMAHGPAGMWPDAARGLFEVLKGAEGWRGQGQQGQQGQQGAGPFSPPAGGGFPGASGPAGHGYAAGAGTHGAGIPATAYGTQDQHGLASGVKDMNLGAGAGAGPSTGAFGGGPAPAPPMTAAEAKAAEAAAEAAKYPPQPYVAPPPTYPGPVEELPPAYVEDGQYRPPVDGKTGQH